MPYGIYPPGSGRPGGRPCSCGGRSSGSSPRFSTPCGFSQNRGDWRNHESMRRDRFRRDDAGVYGVQVNPAQPASQPAGSWYGIPGVWEMMPGLDGGRDGEDI